jgi:LysM repeat protein
LNPEQSSFYHEVEAGDTLNKISRKYGVPVGQLLATNNSADKDRIYPGQRISISFGA